MIGVQIIRSIWSQTPDNPPDHLRSAQAGISLAPVLQTGLHWEQMELVHLDQKVER